MIQLKETFIFRNTRKSHTEPNQVTMVTFQHWHSYKFWTKIILSKVLCGKVHCHDAKSTQLAKALVFFHEYAVANIQNLKAEGLTDCFIGTNLLRILLFISKKQISMISTFSLETSVLCFGGTVKAQSLVTSQSLFFFQKVRFFQQSF
jgi:hypothetical protein